MYQSDAAGRQDMERRPGRLGIRWRAKAQQKRPFSGGTTRDFPRTIGHPNASMVYAWTRNMIGLMVFFGILWFCGMIIVAFVDGMTVLFDMAALPLGHQAILHATWKPSLIHLYAVWKPSLVFATAVFLLVLLANPQEQTMA
jgi:hypothetical protein